jgi:anti-sigma factor RsiW
MTPTPSCRALGRLVESYLDGELQPSQLLEVETHTETCATCRERVLLDRSIRHGVRKAVQGATASPGFRERAASSVVAQRRAAEAQASESAPVMPVWSTWVIAAGAAAALGAVVVHRRTVADLEHAVDRAGIEQSSIPLGIDAMIDQFVDWHARPLPPEITNPNDLPGFEPYVGVPVHPPAFSPFGAHLLGGRILPVKDARVAAMLQYTLGSGHRVSVYVYDPRRIQINPSRLHPHTSVTAMMSSDPVYVGRVRGWSVAAAERRGVGYAVASDLDDDESAELALAAAP